MATAPMPSNSMGSGAGAASIGATTASSQQQGSAVQGSMAPAASSMSLRRGSRTRKAPRALMDLYEVGEPSTSKYADILAANSEYKSF
jgi:hypothetical protein